MDLLGLYTISFLLISISILVFFILLFALRPAPIKYCRRKQSEYHKAQSDMLKAHQEYKTLLYKEETERIRTAIAEKRTQKSVKT